MSQMHLIVGRRRESENLDVVVLACKEVVGPHTADPIFSARDHRVVTCGACMRTDVYRERAEGVKTNEIRFGIGCVGLRVLKGDQYQAYVRDGVGVVRKEALDNGYQLTFRGVVIFVTDGELRSMRNARKRDRERNG